MLQLFFAKERSLVAHALSVTGKERAKEKDRSETPMQEASPQRAFQKKTKMNIMQKHSQKGYFQKTANLESNLVPKFCTTIAKDFCSL